METTPRASERKAYRSGHRASCARWWCSHPESYRVSAMDTKHLLYLLNWRKT